MWELRPSNLSNANVLEFRTVDNFIAALRAKLEADPANPRHLLTCRGAGYRLQR